MKKAYLQISFSWIFAIIVGIAILLLTIYGVSKMSYTESIRQNIEASKEVGVLLNPLETNFEEAKVNTISFPSKTRIYDKCDIYGNFGNQKIQISQENFNKFTPVKEAVFQNKYIFSENPAEGKNFYIFSKPFRFPFKVADLIYIIPNSKKYCFLDAPENIKREITDLEEPNLLLDNCTKKSTKVCFNNANCEINVDYENKYVTKDSQKMYFEGNALMYGAIFSGKQVYECQVKRLMKRTSELCLLYKEKSDFISNSCESGLNPDLLILKSSADNLNSSDELYQTNLIAENLGEENDNNWECKLW